MRTLLTAVVLLFTQSLLAQTTVTGTIKDTADKKLLTNAVVSLVKKDSTLYKFTRSNSQGNFLLQNVAPGSYRLLITHPKFADYSDDLNVKAEAANLGTIALTQKAQLLQAVIIKSAGAVRIKGDTTEFVADSFRVREGATVEELLKKLPGFQVNSKGEITAQGQRVQKVLVDGEEFFGDDPSMATKNISARAVDKVQVFDNKSEQQNLTGITTGQEGKTVNIKLKEDSKKGSFGRAEAGSDFDKVVDAKLLYNRFVGKRKLSVYATKSNTNTGSLNWEDSRRLGFENDFEYDELSGYYFSFGNSDEFSDWSLRGLPNAYTAGGLYINKWDEDRKSLNGSYRFNRLGTSNVGTRLVQSIVPNNVFNTATRSRTSGFNQQHAGNFKYEWKLDSLRSFKLVSALTHKNTESFSNSQDETSNPLNSRRTLNERNNTNNATKGQTDTKLEYKQLFQKKNRLFMATVRYGTVNDDQNGFLYSNIRYYNGATLDSSQLLDQQKINRGTSQTVGAKLSFVEPLSNRLSLVGEYSYNLNASESHRNTYDRSNNGKYEILNSVFSNNFDLDATSHSGTIFSRYMYKKLRFSVGSGLSSIKLNLKDLDRKNTNVYRFTNLTPQASINYALKTQTSIGVNYRGTTRQPTINQLQPLRDNNDPLNVYIGNPDLRVGFNHNINLFYNSYKVLASRGIWANASINFTNDAISQMSTFDVNTGKRTFMPVNVDGNYNWNLWTEWNKGEGEKKFNHTAGVEARGGRNVAFINSLLNQNNYYSFDLHYGLRWENPEKFKIFLQPKGGYNFTRSSLNPTAQNNYFNYGGEAEAYMMLPGKLELNTSIDFDLRQRIAAFVGSPNVILWKADLTRRIFKNKSGRIGIFANDILDQNRGFQRNINSERITEETFQRLSRYVMLKLEWSFNKMPGQK